MIPLRVLVSLRMWFSFLIIKRCSCVPQQPKLSQPLAFFHTMSIKSEFFVLAFKYIIARFGRILKCNLHNRWRLCHWQNVRVAHWLRFPLESIAYLSIVRSVDSQKDFYLFYLLSSLQASSVWCLQWFADSRWKGNGEASIAKKIKLIVYIMKLISVETYRIEFEL